MPQQSVWLAGRDALVDDLARRELARKQEILDRQAAEKEAREAALAERRVRVDEGKLGLDERKLQNEQALKQREIADDIEARNRIDAAVDAYQQARDSGADEQTLRSLATAIFAAPGGKDITLGELGLTNPAEQRPFSAGPGSMVFMPDGSRVNVPQTASQRGMGGGGNSGKPASVRTDELLYPTPIRTNVVQNVVDLKKQYPGITTEQVVDLMSPALVEWTTKYPNFDPNEAIKTIMQLMPSESGKADYQKLADAMNENPLDLSGATWAMPQPAPSVQGGAPGVVQPPPTRPPMFGQGATRWGQPPAGGAPPAAAPQAAAPPSQVPTPKVDPEWETTVKQAQDEVIARFQAMNAERVAAGGEPLQLTEEILKQALLRRLSEMGYVVGGGQ